MYQIRINDKSMPVEMQKFVFKMNEYLTDKYDGDFIFAIPGAVIIKDDGRLCSEIKRDLPTTSPNENAPVKIVTEDKPKTTATKKRRKKNRGGILVYQLDDPKFVNVMEMHLRNECTLKKGAEMLQVGLSTFTRYKKKYITSKKEAEAESSSSDDDGPHYEESVMDEILDTSNTIIDDEVIPDSIIESEIVKFKDYDIIAREECIKTLWDEMGDDLVVELIVCKDGVPSNTFSIANKSQNHGKTAVCRAVRSPQDDAFTFKFLWKKLTISKEQIFSDQIKISGNFHLLNKHDKWITVKLDIFIIRITMDKKGDEKRSFFYENPFVPFSKKSITFPALKK